MNDVMVTIRMPKTLADSLKQLAEKNHFLDLSEQVRSIVRNKWSFHTEFELYQLNKLRENVADQIKQKTQSKIQSEVAKELGRIKDQLKKEGYVEK